MIISFLFFFLLFIYFSYFSGRCLRRDRSWGQRLSDVSLHTYRTEMMTTLMDRLLLIVLFDVREKDKECKKKRGFYWCAVVCSRCGAGPPGGRWIDFRTFYLSLFTFQLVMCRIVSWGFVFFSPDVCCFCTCGSEFKFSRHVCGVMKTHTRRIYCVCAHDPSQQKIQAKWNRECVSLCVWLPLWHTHTHAEGCVVVAGVALSPLPLAALITLFGEQ